MEVRPLLSLERKARIFNMQKYSIYDGPGIRTIIFFKGCPLRCQWCANPEGLKVPSHVSGRTVHPLR